MQLKNWSDLRYLLAVKRGKTLSGAAQRLGVDDTTVARRLSVLADVCEVALWTRTRDRSFKLTGVGEQVADRVEAIEHQIELISELCGSHIREVAGLVRVTSVPFVVSFWLAPNLCKILQQHPNLEIELSGANRNVSLEHREADIGLRLAKPRDLDPRLHARQVGVLTYSVYVRSDAEPDNGHGVPWIQYQETMGTLAQIRWIREVAREAGEPMSGVTIEDAATALEAVLGGVGKTLLPDIIVPETAPLKKVDLYTEPPKRELWLVARRDLLELNRVAVVAKWLAELAERDAPA